MTTADSTGTIPGQPAPQATRCAPIPIVPTSATIRVRLPILPNWIGRQHQRRSAQARRVLRAYRFIAKPT